MDAKAKLDDFARRMRATADLGPAIAKRAAPLVLEAVRATASAGTAPGGDAWPATKANARKGRISRPALPGVAGKISFKITNGDTIRIAVGVPYVFHNWGSKTKGFAKRKILPTKLGGEVERVIDESAKIEFLKTMKGGA